MVTAVRFKGRKLYIHGHGNFLVLKPKKEGALEELPSTHEVRVTKTGRPYIKKK